MEYITLVEPRQHGKTSLINRIIGEFSPQGFSFALCDLMAAKVSDASCAAWYTSLGLRILGLLDFIPGDRCPVPPTDSSSWETFLAAIAQEAMRAGRGAVIVLDEIGAMPVEWATDFFSIIRSTYTTRQSCPHWRNLTFIIAGAFNPRDLIKEKSVSNFNIDQRVTLDDFGEAQVRWLIDRAGLPHAEVEATARRIQHWADGQPYLTQYLCQAFASGRDDGPGPIEAGVDRSVEAFFREDTSHLARIVELAEDPDLMAYARKITGSTPSRFSPGVNDKQFRLANILGVIKASPEGLCQIRNRIYQRALDECDGAVDEVGDRTIGLDSAPRIRGRDPDACASTENRQGVACSGPLCRLSRPSIFVSYSRKDAREKKIFDRHMAPLRRYHDIEAWSDEDIPVGSDWWQQIEDAMERAGVAVALVTSNFLASQFCMDVEFRRFLQARAERGLILVAVIVSECLWQAVPDLARYQLLPRDRSSIKSTRDRERAWSKVVKEIGELLNIQWP
jgi:hypothetical protein